MASFNQTFDFAHWDQSKFDSYRQLRDEPADNVARLILNSPHYSQVYEALSKIVKNNDVVTLQMFSDIIRDRNAKMNVAYNVPTAGNIPTAGMQHPVQQDPLTKGQQMELNEHNDDDCATDGDHEKLVDALNKYFNDLSLFDFVKNDPETIDHGNDIFNVDNIHCILALGVRSLMKQYAAYNATQVLKFTKLISSLPYRRIMETVQFVLDVMDPEGFTENGCAIRSIQKLRLVHAMIRVRIDMKLYDQNPIKDQVVWGHGMRQNGGNLLTSKI